MRKKHFLTTKKTSMKSATMKCIFFMTTFLSTVQLWAQDKKMDVDIDINKKDADWYMQPWVWVVGAAVFIIIIVAILKGSGKKQ
jgi:ABC-type uncharacterized transport system fused permease/ATPase subunit